MGGPAALATEAGVDHAARAAFQTGACPQAEGAARSHMGSRVAGRLDKGMGDAAPAAPGLGSRGTELPPRRRQPFNLESFVVHCTPSVPYQYLPKSKSWDAAGGSARPWSAVVADAIPYFSLADLWEAFGEWSVYGAGVPLVLNADESVVQYYVPYLSALQLYVRAGYRGESIRACEDGDDHDCKDSCSESSDSEHDRHFAFTGSETSSEAGNSEGTCPEDEGDVSASECRSKCKDCRGKHCVFEYFADTAPYSRVPLSNQIAELEASCTALKSLRSIDLHPASWFSVAWYPVYRIPTGPTLKDLGASFLSYHALSSPLCGSQELCTACAKCTMASIELPKASNQSLRAKEETLGSDTSVDISSTVLLQPFGLAAYKLGGNVWSMKGAQGAERQRLGSLQDGARIWLQQQGLHHPDYVFFSSHSNQGAWR